MIPQNFKREPGTCFSLKTEPKPLQAKPKKPFTPAYAVEIVAHSTPSIYTSTPLSVFQSQSFDAIKLTL